jgi:hypothetical protein
MSKFASREEYERWKAAREGRADPAPAAPPTGSPSAPAAASPPPRPAPGFSIAKTKPRRTLLVVAAVLLGGAAVYLFALGDVFSGAFVLALCVFIAGVYVYYRLNPQYDDAQYWKDTLAVGARALAHHGRISEADAEAAREAKRSANERYQAAQREPE